MIRSGTILLALFTSACLCGCAPGYNSVLLATKSNIGIDLDAEPPTLEVAISRQEGVIEPAFEGGQTLPVLSSFSASAMAFPRFFFGVDSTFSTGEAAYLMSYLYSDHDPSRNEEIPYSGVTLSKPPELPCCLEFVKPGQVKPVTFGTETLLGFKIGWSGRTAQYPSSIKLGFNRKEAAWVPVSLRHVKGGSEMRTAHIPSLLATIDSNVNVEGLETKLKHLQYFATGRAATNLARRRAVREAMLKRTDPENASGFEMVAHTRSSLELQALLIQAEMNGKKEAQITRIKDWLKQKSLDEYSWKDLVYNMRLEDERVAYLKTLTVKVD